MNHKTNNIEAIKGNGDLSWIVIVDGVMCAEIIESSSGYSEGLSYHLVDLTDNRFREIEQANAYWSIQELIDDMQSEIK